MWSGGENEDAKLSPSGKTLLLLRREKRNLRERNAGGAASKRRRARWDAVEEVASKTRRDGFKESSGGRRGGAHVIGPGVIRGNVRAKVKATATTRRELKPHE